MPCSPPASLQRSCRVAQCDPRAPRGPAPHGSGGLRSSLADRPPQASPTRSAERRDQPALRAARASARRAPFHVEQPGGELELSFRPTVAAPARVGARRPTHAQRTGTSPPRMGTRAAATLRGKPDARAAPRRVGVEELLLVLAGGLRLATRGIDHPAACDVRDGRQLWTGRVDSLRLQRASRLSRRAPVPAADHHGSG